MKFFFFFTFFVICITDGILGMTLPERTCNDPIETQANFDIERYAGSWWEVLRYENHFEKNMQCITAKYTAENGSLGVDHGGVRGLTGVMSKATISRSDPSGTDGKLQIAYNGSPHPLNYWVLATDYDTYAVVYTCMVTRDGNNHISSWVLTRESALNGEIIATVDGILKKNNLPWEPYLASYNSKAACETASH